MSRQTYGQADIWAGRQYVRGMMFCEIGQTENGFLSVHEVFISVCNDMYMYVVFFPVNHRIVYVYVWFVSMCLCCIRPNKSYVVVVVVCCYFFHVNIAPCDL